jgi:squalene synthase HpnC
MSDARYLSSGKTHRDENFPVASFVIAPRYRSAILAFYRFARTADDVADDAFAGPDEKLQILDTMRQSLCGGSDASPEACQLRRVLSEKNLSTQHGLDLLEAFRRDVTKLRYESWDELMDYCRYSAMPVGRFVLDVHGEAPTTWPASDALCAALQVINHLQDCGKDFRMLNRLYIPLDALARNNLSPETVGAARATPRLKQTIAELAARVQVMLYDASNLASQIRNFRLALEVGIITRLAKDLASRLAERDPLSERVHHNPVEALGLALSATAEFLIARPRARRSAIVLVQL